MTTNPPLVIPRLIARTDTPAPVAPKWITRKGRPLQAIPDRLVAAVRWDYEVGLLSQTQCVARYSTLLSAHSVRDICAGRTHPDVKASRLKLLWR